MLELSPNQLGISKLIPTQPIAKTIDNLIRSILWVLTFPQFKIFYYYINILGKSKVNKRLDLAFYFQNLRLFIILHEPIIW